MSHFTLSSIGPNLRSTSNNVRSKEKAGAALVELDDEPNQLWDKVDSLLKDDARRSEMALAAANLGMSDAADRIARAILKMEKYYAKNAE